MADTADLGEAVDGIEVGLVVGDCVGAKVGQIPRLQDGGAVYGADVG